MSMRKECGFTLVEMLVALAVFLLIGGLAFNLLVSSIASQRKALKDQAVVDQISFVAEYMSRAIRQAEKDLADECLASGADLLNYKVLAGGQTLRFLDKDKICREFSFDSVALAIQERRSSDQTATFGPWVALTSNDIDVGDLRFFIQGEEQTDQKQPRVTFFIDAQGLRLQTTISQRRFDVVE